MIPEEEHGTWGWFRDPEIIYADESWKKGQGQYWCDVCDQADSFEHDVITEHDIAGTVTLTYCTETGKVIDTSAKRDITQAELDYVKQSLGVVDA